jgi:hypothetical protein
MVYYGHKIFNAPPPPPPSPLQTEWVTVKAKFNGLIPEVAALIDKGDYEGIVKHEAEGKGHEYGKNPEIREEIIAKVKDNPIIETQKTLSFYELREYKWLPYPSHQKDITLNLDILCTRKDDGLTYYKNSSVKVGTSFSFQTKEYDINGIIIGIERQKNQSISELGMPPQ